MLGTTSKRNTITAKMNQFISKLQRQQSTTFFTWGNVVLAQYYFLSGPFSNMPKEESQYIT